MVSRVAAWHQQDIAFGRPNMGEKQIYLSVLLKSEYSVAREVLLSQVQLDPFSELP